MKLCSRLYEFKCIATTCLPKNGNENEIRLRTVKNKGADKIGMGDKRSFLSRELRCIRNASGALCVISLEAHVSQSKV